MGSDWCVFSSFSTCIAKSCVNLTSLTNYSFKKFKLDRMECGICNLKRFSNIDWIPSWKSLACLISMGYKIEIAWDCWLIWFKYCTTCWQQVLPTTKSLNVSKVSEILVLIFVTIFVYFKIIILRVEFI